MKLTKIRMGRLVSLPGYENFRVELEGDIEEGEALEQAVLELSVELNDTIKSRNAQWNPADQYYQERLLSVRKEIIEAESRTDRLLTQIRGLESFVEENKHIKCPHCGSENIEVTSEYSASNEYVCMSCEKSFEIPTGTLI